MIGAWKRARELAERTPASRNRYVDLLRAVSILAVVSGHWLIAAPHYDEGAVRLRHMLEVSPWTQWLTFLFQVMPVFFLVGGYSNAAAWSAARERGVDYGAWLYGRLRRLVIPVIPVWCLWIGLTAVARLVDFDAERVSVATQAALVPTWFLAVYVLVALPVPWTYRLWERLGFGSFALLALLAAAVDAVRFLAHLGWFGWWNYWILWAAIHQLGYAWRDGRLGGVRRALPWLLAGVTGLGVVIVVFGYPRSMVSVPGEAVSNTLPPSLAMLFLGLAEIGAVLLLEPAARARLERTAVWTPTILVNGMIMTVYLWHMTVCILLVAGLGALGSVALHVPPGTPTWWASRPFWIAALAAAAVPFLLVFSAQERPRPTDHVPGAAAQLAAAFCFCAGVGAVALLGMSFSDWRAVATALPLVAGFLLRPPARAEPR